MPSVRSTPRTTRNSRGLRGASIEPIGPAEQTTNRTGLATRRGRHQYRATPYPPRASHPPSPESLEALTSPIVTAVQSPLAARRATSSAANATSPASAYPSHPETPPNPRHALLQSIEEEQSYSQSPLHKSVNRLRQQRLARDRSVSSSPFGADFTFTSSPPLRVDRGYETAAFIRRRGIVGEEKFARELHMAIRNDHFMRQCCCGLPPIYNSLEDAKRGAGHLRFYTSGSDKNNLRVIQVRIDDRWHCQCLKSKVLDHIYQQHIAKGRKRPATDSEFDLIAQNQTDENNENNSIERVIPGSDITSKGQPTEGDNSVAGTIPIAAAAQPGIFEQESVAEASVESAQTASAQPMWSYISGPIATMGASVMEFVGKFIPRLSSGRREAVENVEAVETVQQNPVTNQLSVKRFKREYAIPHALAATGLPPELSSNGPKVTWANDPATNIGFELINGIHTGLSAQLENLVTHKYIGGYTWHEMLPFLADDDVDASLSAVLCTMVFDTVDESAGNPHRAVLLAKTKEMAKAHEASLKALLGFIEGMYADHTAFELHRTRFPEPSLPFPVGNIEWRKIAGDAATLLTWFIKNRESVGIDDDFAVVLIKILADAKAVHKQEYPPSWIEFVGVSRQGTELPTTSVFEEIPIGEFEVQPAHEVKFPEPGPSSPVSLADPRAVKRMKYSPKPILKPATTEWPTPSSPQYVATPEKQRKLAFQNPAVRYGGPPSNIPVKVMTAWERYIEHKPHYNEKALARAEKKFQLRHLGNKYNPLLDGLYDGIEKRKAAREAKYTDDKPDVSLYAMTAEAKEARRKRDEQMREQFDRKKKWSSQLAAIRDKQPQTPQPKLPERLVFDDTPEEVRKMMDEEPIRRPKPQLNRAAMLKKFSEQTPLSPADRRKAIDRALLGPGGDQKSTEFPPDPFEDDYDELEIAAKRLEKLELEKQISIDWHAAILRSREEKRLEEIAEAARRKEEAARKRAEEERQKKEAERLKAIADAAALSGLRRPFAPLITDISPEWEDKIIEAEHQITATTKICTAPDGTDLCRRDFAEMLLPPTAWLNDNVIVGSFDYIARYVNDKAGVAQKVNPKCCALTSFFYNRLLSHGVNSCGRMARNVGIKKANFFDIETILIPICQQAHWTLAVVRPQQRTVSHLDSMLAGRGHAKVKATILSWVKATLEERFVESEWKLVDFDAPLQTNGYDCGVFAITNGICLALGVNPMGAYGANQLTLQRHRLAAVLINGGFTGDFSLDHI
ncbi:hypothetical protein QBC34DRAFT_390799 [Podospora aff. communis PSN243]|uniref:Ubiquitin-like protease family profile domain-containing protein n=1 Tax=Podospora aff. communis PSN243 TaxID=3040156 RepID=A0AAV9H5H0_9PEZI|nr:hypothetical protein QBC34DRAFT_390799 [Podospora aff. communis PSN243]